VLDSKEQIRLLRDVRLALQKDDYPTAIASLEKAAQIAGESGDIGMEGRHLGNLALLYYRLKQPHKALEYFEQALALARKDEDRTTEGGLLGNVGNILREMGRHEEAYEYLSQALIIADEIDDRRGGVSGSPTLACSTMMCNNFRKHSIVIRTRLRLRANYTISAGWHPVWATSAILMCRWENMPKPSRLSKKPSTYLTS